jgi:hypothetical protein
MADDMLPAIKVYILCEDKREASRAMAYQKKLQVVYHQQDTDYYCGAACAQMVLDSIGTGLLDQDSLYADSHSHSRDESNLEDIGGSPVMWSTAPDGLEWVLNDRRPAGFTNPFREFSLDSKDAISRKIAWTIEHYGIAPCALVFEAKHWVAIRGMDVSKAPTSSDDTSYTINSFRMNNPWPPVPSWDAASQSRDMTLVPPPPHSNTDNCGTGGDRGVADEVISYMYWGIGYMTGAWYSHQGHWQGKFVAVCDPDPPATRPGPSVPRIHRFDGERLINRDQATHLAMEMVEKGQLPQDKPWLESLKGVRPANAIMIQRLDREDDYYYIVPLVSGKKEATAALQFDARFGDFQQAISFPKPDPRLTSLPTSEAVLKQVVGKAFKLERYGGYLRIREEAAVILPLWFWKPCLESLYPFWPFYMVVTGGNTIYVRIDGQVFTKLHENVFGI